MVEARADLQDLVLDVVRSLAGELGGERAERAVSATGVPRARHRPRKPRARRAHASPRGRPGAPPRRRGPRHRHPRRAGPRARRRPAPQPRPPAPRAMASVLRERGTAPGAATPPSTRRSGDAPCPIPTASTPTCARTTAPRPRSRYGRLWNDAAAVAGGLRERGVRKGDTVALMLPTGVDFLRTFQGILIAGAVPVPIYPPARLDRLEEYALTPVGDPGRRGASAFSSRFPRATGVASLLRPRVPTLAGRDERRRSSWPSAPRGPRAEGLPSDPAFIQYTSGSTGQPEGRPPHPREPPGQHEGHRRGGRGVPHRRRRELAAALPRHGADRLLALLPVPRPPHRHPVPARVPRSPRALALDDPPAAGHALGGTQLRLRAVRHARSPTRPSRGSTSRRGAAR